jgi:oligoendopeptidase F
MVRSIKGQVFLGSRRWFGVLACLCAFLSPHIEAQRSAGNQEVDRYVWDLSSLYPSDTAWEADRNTIARKLQTIGSLKGTVGQDAGAFARAMDEIADLRRRAGKMAEYGILVSMADTSSDKAQAQYNVGISLETQVEGAVSFVEDEVRNTGPERIAQYMRERPELAVHRRRIHEILREAPHILGPEAQAVVGNLNRWPLVSWDTYWALSEADLGWATVDGPAGGKTVANRAAYFQLRSSDDRKLGAAVASAYLGKLKAVEIPFGTLLTRRIEADLTIARDRKFRDGIESQLFREGMPASAQSTLVQVAHANIATFHHYLALRSRAFGVSQASYLDAYADLPGASDRFTVQQSMDAIVAASALLGTDYQARLRERVATPWAHLPPWPQKREEYGIWYAVGGANPYGFMKYRETFNDSSGLAGLATLLMSYENIPHDRPTDTRNDPGIYSNAILYSGMILHVDYLKDHARDRQQRMAYLIRALDRTAQTIFRHTLTTEFESAIQEQILNGHPPSGDQISAQYLKLLRQYFGEGANRVDDIYAREWMSVRLPFGSFETINWPFAMAAACSLVEKVRSGDMKARKGFDEVLGRGESDLSYDLLREAGVDLNTPEPYNAAVRRMNRLLDELETLLKQRE